MVQWVYPREGWFVCKEQKFNFFWRSSILQSLTPIKPLKEYRTQHHHCSLHDIDLSAQVWWNFLERTIEANWSGKIETGTPTTLPSLFPLVTLSAVYQILVCHTKGGILVYHTKGGISDRAQYFPTMMNSFQHVLSGQNMFLALWSIPLANVGGFSWLMSPLWFNPAHKCHVNVVPSNPKVSHKCQCFPWPETALW